MNITQEMIKARELAGDPLNHTHDELVWALNVLDNAGVFAPIDQRTEFRPLGDPSEWGDTVAKVNIVNDDEDLTVECTQHGELFRGVDTFENRADAHEVKALHNAAHVDRAGRKGRETLASFQG